MKAFRLYLFATVFAAFVVSCGDSSSKSSQKEGTTLSMKADMSIPLAKSAAGDTVTLDSAKVLLKRMKFESTTDEDSADFKIGPFIVRIDLTGGVTDITTSKIPNGTYDKIKFKIHKPEDDEDIADPDFKTGTSDDERFSIVVFGKYNNVPFVYKSKKDVEQKLDINPPLVVSDSTTSTNATLLVTPAVWFLKDGQYLNPNAESDRDDIDDNIKKSFKKVFKDNDHDGDEHDEDDDHDDHDDDHGND